MTNRSLATSYLIKARKRMLVLELLLREEAYSDVVREAQELVELALKALLRQAGIEPPKWHDVGGTVREFHDRFPTLTADELTRVVEVSSWLRKEREASQNVSPGGRWRRLGPAKAGRHIMVRLKPDATSQPGRQISR